MVWHEQIPVVDTHLHLWDINKLDYPWLNEVPAIKTNFHIEDYQTATERFNIEKMVFVQCECLPEQNLQEIEFVTQQALRDNRISGMVAYAPLEQGKRVRKVLEVFETKAIVKGVRRMCVEDPDLCCSTPFLDGVNLLPEFDLSFDICTTPYHMKAIIQMVEACPQTQFVLDHLGKPDIKNQKLAEYKRNLEALASFPNVVAKISGLITEADRERWTVADLVPYVEHAVDCFGYNKLMFGGDWPVVLLAGSYERWLNALLEALMLSSKEELSGLFHDNAIRIYRL